MLRRMTSLTIWFESFQARFQNLVADEAPFARGLKDLRAFFFQTTTLSGKKCNAGGVCVRQYPGTTKLPAWVRALERELSDGAPVEIV